MSRGYLIAETCPLGTMVYCSLSRRLSHGKKIAGHITLLGCLLGANYCYDIRPASSPPQREMIESLKR